MFGNREVHRKLSGTGGYAAGRLAEISESLGQLAKVMKNSGEDPGLSREDGIAALESAASMVCGSCDRCGMKQECLEDQDGENYFLYYLLRSFEKKGALEYPDMPREFLDRCRKKTDYLRELNRSLGRSTMNLAWKNRFLESRDAVMLQFEEMAGILGEFSGQMEQAADVTEALVPAVRAAFRKRRIALEDMLVLKYGDGTPGGIPHGTDRKRTVCDREGHGGAVWTGCGGGIYPGEEWEDAGHEKIVHGASHRKGKLPDPVWMCEDPERGGRSLR